MSTTENDIETRVREKLNGILDPCSTFTDNPVTIIDLGLVEEVSVNDGLVKVRLLPTNQLCMYMMNMSDEIQTEVSEIAGVDEVQVDQETEKTWTQNRMTDEVHEERHKRFQERVEKYDITPYYDLEQSKT